MKLSQLHESFIDKAKRPMTFGRLPVDPSVPDPVIIPINKWEKLKSPVRLQKTFTFSSQEKRNLFINEIFEHEEKTHHHATIMIDEGKVTLSVRTKDIDQITELDKEYAKFADVIFRDIVYNLSAKDEF